MSHRPIDRDDVIWAYRLLLDREPESDQAIEPKLRAWRTTAELRRDIVSSAEYRLKNPDPAHSGAAALVIKPIGEARLWIDLADEVIGLPILRDRYEPDMVALARGLVRPGDVAVDVGAHIGFFTISLADAVGSGGFVHAFEPLPRNADLLERSIAESRYGDRVSLVRAAVSDRAGEIPLLFAAETLNTGGAFISDRVTPDERGLATLRVPTLRLDDQALRRPVRLIKMDVEGAEPLVVAGARRLLAADRPYILSEIHPAQLARVAGISAAAFLGELSSLGYRARHSEAGRLGGPVDADAITDVVTVVLEPA